MNTSELGVWMKLSPRNLPPVRFAEADDKRRIVQELDRLLTDRRPPKDFLEPLGRLLHNTPVASALIDDAPFYRARRLDEGKSLFTHVEDLGPPAAQKKNRLNDKETPVLYAAFTPYTAMVEIRGRPRELIAIAEIRPKLGHTDLMKFLPLGLPGGRYAWSTRGESDCIVLEYLRREITKHVPTGQEHEYHSTIAIAHKFLRTPISNSQHDVGVIYPSAQIGPSCNDDYFNIAMTLSSYKTHYEIVGASIYIANPKSPTNLDFMHVNTATSDNGELNWEHKTVSEMKLAYHDLIDILHSPK